MPRAIVRVLALGRVSLNLKTFRVTASERVSVDSDGTVNCLGGDCSANGTFITLETEHPNPRELYDALRRVRVLKIEVEVIGLPNWLLSRLEFLVGEPVSGRVRYTWRTMPSFGELALVLNDLNLHA